MPNLPQPADADALYEFPPVLAAFYKEAKLGVLWQQAQPDYDRAIAQFHEPVVFAVQQVNAYLRHVDTGVRRGRFQILVDLMGAPNQVQFRNYIDDYFVVVTPAVELPIFDIRHAYLRYRWIRWARGSPKTSRKKPAWASTLCDSPLLAEAVPGGFRPAGHRVPHQGGGKPARPEVRAGGGGRARRLRAGAGLRGTPAAI